MYYYKSVQKYAVLKEHSVLEWIQGIDCCILLDIFINYLQNIYFLIV